MSRNSPFIEPKISLPCSQQPDTGTYLDPVHTIFFISSLVLPGLKSRPGTDYPERFRGFPQPLQANAWLVPSTGEPGSSVSIVSDYGLDERAIQVRSPAKAKDFSFSLCVQAGCEAHTASCIMGTGGVLSPGVKRGRGVPRSRMSRSYTSSPPSAFVEYSGTAFVP
jgi:hypothetical protein